MSDSSKQFCSCELLSNIEAITFYKKNIMTERITELKFSWSGASPKAGQFFMLKPKNSSVFLGRPISVFSWDEESVSFLVLKRGRGTEELADLRKGEQADLIGPLGNAWKDNLSGDFPIALVSGGIGIAPMLAFTKELEAKSYDFFAGFKSYRNFFLNSRSNLQARSLVIANEVENITTDDVVYENGYSISIKKGLVTDFLNVEQYKAVYACGPEAMLKAVANICKKASVPCFISMERHMACGLGTCLGCTIKTTGGNRRCCTEGPVFNADDVFFDE